MVSVVEALSFQCENSPHPVNDKSTKMEAAFRKLIVFIFLQSHSEILASEKSSDLVKPEPL